MSASAGEDFSGPTLAFPPDYETDRQQPSIGTLSTRLPQEAPSTTTAEELEVLAVAALRILHYRCTSLENVTLGASYFEHRTPEAHSL